MTTLIERIQATGLTDPQEIVDVIKSSGITVSPVNRAELIHRLNMRGMLRKIVGNNSSEKWEGSVLRMQDVILAMGTEEQKNGIRLWLSHVTNVSNNIWDTTQEEFAKPFREMIYAFGDQTIDLGAGPLVMPTRADFDAILELGGGWVYETLTTEQVAAVIQAEAARLAAEALNAAKQNVVSATRTAMAEILSPVQAKSTAVNAWLDVLDVSTKTVEEIQAYCNSLLESFDGNPPQGSE